MSFEMLAVGIRGVPFPSAGKTNYCLRRTFVEVDTHFCKCLLGYQLLGILPSKVIFQQKIPAASHSITCDCRTQLTFGVEIGNRMALVRE